MLVIIPICILALLLSFLASYNKKSHGLELCFILVTYIQAVHYFVGNDYGSYFYLFLDLLSNDYSFSELFDEGVNRNNEYGWGVLNWTFGKLFNENGFFVLVAVLAIIQNIIYYYFIKTYVDRRWWVYGVFIYLFTTSFYLLSYSGLRQWFVIALSVLLFVLLEKRHFLLAVLLFLFCITIHTSSWVLLFYFVFFIFPIRSGNLLGIIFIISFFLLFLFPSTVESTFAFIFQTEAMDIYSSYQYVAGEGSFGIIFILSTIPFFLNCAYLIGNKSAKKGVLRIIIISSIGTMVLPFGTFIPLVARLSYYFSILSLASYSIAFKWINNAYVRVLILSISILVTLFGYINFFKQGVFADYYRDYNTIFNNLL